MREYVTALYRDPFALGSPRSARFPAGLRLDEMAERMPGLPRGFALDGEIRIDGAIIPRAAWRLTKPKARRAGRPVAVTFHARIRGGGGGGKSGLAIVGALVIAIAATAISGGVLGPAGALSISASLGAGSVGAVALSAAVSIVGGLLLRALAPPPVRPKLGQQGEFNRDARGSASAQGNILEPNGPIPRVVGSRKIFPPLAAEPYVYFEGQDEWVEVIYTLAGPHDLSDIRIDGNPIDEAEDLEFELREGWPGDPALNIVRQQTRTTPIQLEMSQHDVKTDDQDALVDNSPASLPGFHGVSSNAAPDQVLIHLVFGQGLGRLDAVATKPMRVPIRLRLRRLGDVSWINLPELHYEGATLRPERATIRLIFQDGENTVIPNVPSSGAFVEARKLAPGQTTIMPSTDDWAADGYFSAGAGGDWLDQNTTGTTNVRNVTLTAEGANVFLDTGVFTPGIYQIEIMRGAAFLTSNYTVATYFYDDGTTDAVHDFFFWRADGSNSLIPESRENVVDSCTLLRTISLWAAAPVVTGEFAYIAVRARNRRIERLSTVASGYVRDWDGSGWNTWAITSNPAPHFRDVLMGALNLDPLPPALIDDASLVDWRAASITLDYSCDYIAEGDRIADVLTIIGGCGFARPYQSEIWGVIRDLDRSADGPVQVFSPRNSRDFKWSKAFSRLPDGFRINFQDAEIDFTPAQLIVFRPGVAGPRLEQVSYEGLTAIDKLQRRAAFDLAQAELRSTIYSLTVPYESIVARRGSLVGVLHDVLETQAGFGRVFSVEKSGGNVTGITLDSEVPTWDEPDMDGVTDMDAVADMDTVGRASGVAIRRTNGETSVHLLSNATGETNVLTFATPVADDTTAGGPFDPATISQIDVGCLAVTGLFGQEFRRMVVTLMEPSDDFTAKMTLVDEAPELWSAA
jgi:hypothetical protein